MITTSAVQAGFSFGGVKAAKPTKHWQSYLHQIQINAFQLTAAPYGHNVTMSCFILKSPSLETPVHFVPSANNISISFFIGLYIRSFQRFHFSQQQAAHLVVADFSYRNPQVLATRSTEFARAFWYLPIGHEFSEEVKTASNLGTSVSVKHF